MTPKTLRKERKEKFNAILEKNMPSWMQQTSGFREGILDELLDAAESRSELATDEEQPEYVTAKHTAYNRGEQERPDKVLAMLKMANFSGAKVQARIDALLSVLAVEFTKNTETKEWKDFAKYCLSELDLKGWQPEVFIRWVKQQKGYPEFWSCKRMKEDYPKAFTNEGAGEFAVDSNGAPISYS